MNTMQSVSLLMLMVLFFAATTPVTISTLPDEGGAFYMTLDVCGSAGSSMAVSADSPAVLEGCVTFGPFRLSAYFEVSDPVCKPFGLPFNQDRPPAA